MGWAWEARDLDGSVRSLVTPREVVVTRNLNRPSTIALTTDAAGPELGVTPRILRGWRSPLAGGTRVLRATGKVGGLSAQGGADRLESTTLNASDGMGWLAHRFVQETTVFTAQTPRHIVNSLVATQEGRGYLGMTVAAGTAGPPRDRTYDFGKNVAEAIQQLAEVDDGFYYRVDPVDSIDSYCELVLLYPEAGTDTGATFAYGDATMGNLAAVQVDVLPPTNSALVLGSGDGDAQMRATRADYPSIADFGLYETVATHSDVVVQDTLDKHALDALRPKEQRLFRVDVAPYSGGYVPSPWDDFDVGDTVLLRLEGASWALQQDARATVTSFTVTVGPEGVERLTSLDLVEVV